MLGRVQTSGVSRVFRSVHPRCQPVTTRMFSISSSQRFRPSSSLLQSCQKSRNIWGWSTNASPTSAQNAAPPPLASSIPDPEPVTPVISTSEVPAESVASVDPATNVLTDVPVPSDLPIPLEILPLNYGDLAALGFAHWTPAGLCQWTMELIQVSTGIPWFWTIVATTLAARLIVLPFNINSLRITARLAPHQPRLMALRNELSAIGLSKDPIAYQRISLQQKMIYEQAQVSMIQPLMVPLIQLPLSLGMFFGIKRLCELPLEQLKYSGLSFLPDLTVADPTYILPLAMAALINLQLSVGAKDMTTDAAQTLHLFNLFKVVSFVSIPFMANLPAGVLVSLVTGVLSMIVQTMVFRMPAIRRAFNIPIIPQKMRINPPTFLESVRYGVDWMQKKSADAQSQARAQAKKKRH